MRIGIDISQTAFANTGVSNYLSNLVVNILEQDRENEYILFFASLRGSINPTFRKKLVKLMADHKNIKLKAVPIPPTVLNVLWNKLHVMPIENLIGKVDFFLTSDWTEPPARKAKKGSILYDLIVYKYPEETAQNIVSTQKMKHEWMKKEDSVIFCISESTKKDAQDFLKIPSEKLRVIYPGLTI